MLRRFVFPVNVPSAWCGVYSCPLCMLAASLPPTKILQVTLAPDWVSTFPTLFIVVSSPHLAVESLFCQSGVVFWIMMWAVTRCNGQLKGTCDPPVFSFSLHVSIDLFLILTLFDLIIVKGMLEHSFLKTSFSLQNTNVFYFFFSSYALIVITSQYHRSPSSITKFFPFVFSLC